ncbi:hypothetical protein L3X38_025047 [Prunus dulcis]|uniref:Uncharacterized protein n=1 Tax=Prunus dulcis TaxID=3755 RepID=A0AAD4Z728_PRUDU|nr:hypothetical protein L3X38_025047 [Prunus dulcis]
MRENELLEMWVKTGRIFAFSGEHRRFRWLRLVGMGRGRWHGSFGTGATPSGGRMRRRRPKNRRCEQTLTLRVQGESIEFEVFEAVKKSGDLKKCSCIDLLDPIVHVNYLEITFTDVLKAKSPPSPYVKCMCTSLGPTEIYQCFIKSFSKMSRPFWHLLTKDHTKTLHDKAIVGKKFGQQSKHYKEEVAFFATSAPL